MKLAPPSDHAVRVFMRGHARRLGLPWFMFRQTHRRCARTSYVRHRVWRATLRAGASKRQIARICGCDHRAVGYASRSRR